MRRLFLYLLASDLVLGQQNILNNGDFETGMMCYSTSVWSTTGAPYKGDYSFILSGDARSGSRSLEIRCTGADCLKAAIVSEKIQTPPSQSYKLNLYSKCPSGHSAFVYITDTVGGYTFQYLTCNGSWAANQISFTAGPTTSSFSFSIYNLDVEWLRVDDISLTYADGTVPQQTILHPGVRNVSIAGQTVRVDGSPYFPLGFFDIPYADLPEAASLGSNTAVSLEIQASANCFNTWQPYYLDRAYDLGLNFLPNSLSTARLAVPDVFPSTINKFAPHLANIGWLLADEPDQANVAWWYIPAPTLIAEYQAAKTATNLPMVVDFQRASWSTIDETTPYLGSTDIWMAEPYGGDFSYVDHAVNTFNQLRRQPIWLAQDGWLDADLIVPKAYWAVIRGVTGLVYFNWEEIKAMPTKQAAIAQVFRELKFLNPVLFAQDSTSQVTAPQGIGIAARSLNGSLYIFSANPAATTVQGKIQVNGLQAGTLVTVLFENRTITAEAGGFNDTFSGVSRHVYLVGSPPVAVTVASNPPGLTLNVDGQSCIAPCSFQWVPGSSHNVAASSVVATANAGTQYAFAAWSDGGALTHSISIPPTPWTLTANFVTQYYLTTAVRPALGGSISPASGWFNAGATVTLTPTAAAGYRFAGFSGSLSASTSPQVLTIAAPANVMANFTAFSQSGWFDVFSNRRKITLDRTKVAGALSNFPVLVSLTDGELRNLSAGGKVADTAGKDIVFTAADGLTKIPHEIESFNGASGGLTAWVRVDSLSPATDTVVYLYYGKAAAADQQNAAGVWDSAYRIVNHFKDAAVADSTQYRNSPSTVPGAALSAPAQIGSGYSVDGITGQLSIPHSSSWSGTFSGYTVEMWFKPGQMRDYSGAVAIGGWSSPFNIWFYSSGAANFRMDTSGGYCAGSATVPVDSAFHHLAMSYDATAARLLVYIDGVLATPANCNGNVVLPQGALNIGRFLNGTAIQGVFDELRVSVAGRTQAWVATSYANQKSPSTFFTVGAVEASSTVPETVVTSSPTGLALTVDGASCTTPCRFQWTSGSSHTLTAPAQISTSPGAQLAFSSWSDNGAASHSITASTASSTFTATFASQFYLTVSASPSASGAVNPPSGWFTSGSSIALTATANSGYQFSSYSGAITGTSPSPSLILSAPSTVVAIFTSKSTETPSNWYGAWSNRRKITINHSKVAGNLANFPVLVSLIDPDLRSLSQGGKTGKADGTDIVFTAADGLTKIPHEIESFNGASGVLTAWVRVDSLSPATDTVVYLYYGKAAAADQQNAAGVWDSAYRIVNHFKDAAVVDSTQYRNSPSTVPGAALSAPAQIGSGYSVDGITGQLSIPYSSSWSGTFSGYTVEMWFKPGQMRDYSGAVAIGGWSSPFNIWFYSSGVAIFRMDTSSGYCAGFGPVPVDSAFHHLAMSYDATAARLLVYIDGVLATPASCNGNVVLPQGALNIGRFLNGTAIQGVFDELRVSVAGRTQAWVATSYANQKSPSTFFTVGAVEASSTVPETVVTSSPTGLALTVDGASCTTPCRFQWTSGSSHTLTAPAQISTSPGAQLAFSSWSDNGAASHSITASTASSTFTATFASQFYLTVSASPSASGAVNPPSGWFTSGSSIALTATANSGYQFSSYSGAITGTSPSPSLILSAPSTVVAIFTSKSTETPSNWYGAWSNRRKITINHSKVAGNLANFPVLVSLIDPDLRSLSQGGKTGKADGTDIVFTAADGLTKIPHEIESFNGASGVLTAWVRVDSLSPATDTVVYLYYGKAAAADQQNAAGVWDSAYRIVNHFKDAAVADSTQYRNSPSTVPGAALSAPAQIGSGYSVDGITGQLSIPYSSSWSGTFSGYTVEMWFKPGQMRDYSGAVAIGGWSSPFNIWFYSSGVAIFRMDTSSGYCAGFGPVPVDSAFHHLAMSYDATAARLLVYIDGVLATPANCNGNVVLPQGALNIGRFLNGTAIQGVFDELRVSVAGRTQAWVATSYANQKSPSTFFTVGAVEVLP